MRVIDYKSSCSILLPGVGIGGSGWAAGEFSKSTIITKKIVQVYYFEYFLNFYKILKEESTGLMKTKVLGAYFVIQIK